MNQNKVTQYSEKFTASLLNLKINYQIPKHLQCILFFLIAIQPIFFTLQSAELENYQGKWQYKFIQLILRPGLLIVQNVGHGDNYYILIATFIILFHKICLSYFGLIYYKSGNEDFFGKQCQNSFLKKSMCYFLNLYQFLAPSYLLQDFGYISYLSLTQQLHNYLLGKSFSPLLICSNILTIFLILIDSIFFMFIQEQAATNKIQVCERFKITTCRLLQLIITYIQILIPLQNIQYISQVQAILNLIFYFAMIYEIFFNFSFPLQLQKTIQFLAISLNTSLLISYLLRLAENQNIKSQIASFFVLFSLILNILRKKELSQSGKRITNFFMMTNNRVQYVKEGLISLLNDELIGQQEALFMKVMISRDHSKSCINKKCCYCNHLSVHFTEQAFGITVAFYKNFILRKITQIMSVAEKEKRKAQQKEQILSYALFLQDFGWPLKAIKILDQLNSLSSPNQTKFKNLNSLIKEQIVSSRNISMVKSENISSFSDLNEHLINEELLTFYQFSFFEMIQIKFAIQSAKKQISRTFLGSSLMAIQQSLIEEFASEFLRNEVQITKFEDQLLTAVKDKIQLYKDIKTHQDKINYYYNQRKVIYQLSEEVYTLKKQLKQAYKNQPSPRLHVLCCFFYGEIISNYKKAIQLSKKQWHFDSHLNKFQKIQNFDSNQQNFQFAILELQDDMSTLKIKSHSQNFFKFYGKNHCESSFQELLPLFLREIHSLYLTQFFESGFSKFFNVFNVNFIVNPQKILTTVNMCFTLTNLYRLNNLAFAVFLQETTQDQAFLLVDSGTSNCIFTKNLLLLIGWNETQIEHYSQSEKIFNQKIHTVFPSFETQVKGSKQVDIRVMSAVFHLPQPQSSFESIGTDRQQQKIQFISLDCDIIILKRKIHTYSYYIIEILKIQSQTLEKQFIQALPQKQSSFIKSSPQKSHLDCFVDRESDSPQIGVLNSINHQVSLQNGSIQVLEDFKNLQNIFIADSSRFIKDSHYQHELNQSKNTENNYQIVQDAVQNDEIISPQPDVINYSDINLISKRNTSPLLNSAIHNAKNRLLKLKNKKEIKLQPVKYKQQKSKNKQFSYPKEKMHIVYELIDQILQLNSFRFQKKFFTFLGLWHFLFLTLIIITFQILTADLLQFLDYLEMITFHAAIMGPHDLFFSMRVTITAYQQMNREGFIPTDYLEKLTDPYYEYIDLGYTELRDSLYLQLNNQKLQNFLDSVDLTVYFMNENSSQIIPIQLSFRDSLLQVLQYQYAQMITFLQRESTAGKPFQIFLFANYFLFHNECQTLSNSLKQYTFQMYEIIYNKWIYTWAIFSVILVLFFIFLLCYQQRYFIFLQQFEGLFNCLNENILNDEIIRYTSIVKQIANEEISIFDYNSEEQLLNNLKKENKRASSQLKISSFGKNVVKHKNSIRIYNFLFLFLLMTLMFIYTTTITLVSSDYFEKYPSTSVFFSQVQEMKLRSGNLFLYREIFFRWENFTFLTESNKIELYELMEKAQTAIKNYISISNTIDFEYYLVNDNFAEIFNDINTNSFCLYIDEKFLNLTQRYCNIAFEGSIEKGMLYTLNYISNSIKTQQQINNFTQRVEGTYYEQEGSQIVSRIFFVLALSFKDSWLIVTQQLTQLIQTLSICYIVLIVVIFIYLFYFYFPYLGKLLKVNQRIVYFLPFEELMQNEHLERQLKELFNRFKQQ